VQISDGRLDFWVGCTVTSVDGGPFPTLLPEGRSDTLSIPGGVLFLGFRGHGGVNEFVSIGWVGWREFLPKGPPYT
jgi:hypothetical protein